MKVLSHEDLIAVAALLDVIEWPGNHDDPEFYRAIADAQRLLGYEDKPESKPSRRGRPMKRKVKHE